MPVRRGPTERRRSAGTRRRRAQPGAKALWLLSRFSKVTRCKSGTVISRYRSNGYTHNPKSQTPNPKPPAIKKDRYAHTQRPFFTQQSAAHHATNCSA
jgi:hypothetical protein